MAAVVFKRGNPVFDNYTPGSAVAEGAVTVIGDCPVIAHSDLEASVVGAVAIRGGIYKCAKANNEAIAGRTRVYWKASDSTVTTTASTHKVFGYSCADGAAETATTIEVEHFPFNDLDVS